MWKVHCYCTDIEISGGGKNNTVLVTGVVVTLLVLIMMTLLFGAIIIWFRKRYSTSQERKMHFLMRDYFDVQVCCTV